MAQTVEVRKVSGEYLPCKNCKYYSNCIVPKGQHLRGAKKRAIQIIFTCEEYVPKQT